MSADAAGGPDQGPIVSLTAGEGPPLLLLHGLAASARWWELVLPALSAGHRVLAVDLPAFGASGHGVRFHLDRVPGQLIELMDELGLGRASIIGHSMGGLIAARMAVDHPGRVDRLVLVDAGFLRLDPSWLHKVTGPIRAVRFTRPPLARLLMDDLLRVGVVRLADATLQLLRTDWADILPRIVVPTLVVWGGGDTICPPVIGQAIAARVPDARRVVIPDSGHNPMWERPDEFAAAVLPFLDEARAAAILEP
ncbi:MAG: alpha/beta fold hydrolase [Chloroflexota bacterium]